MKVDELKKLIRECVIQSVQQLKEQFDHIEAKASLNKGKAKSVDGVDSGDKKMGPEVGNPPKAVKNNVCAVKDQKGAMNETISSKDAPVLPEKKQEKKDQKLDQTKKQDKKEDMKETKKDQKKQKIKQGMATAQLRPEKGVPQVREDVEVEIPLPRGVDSAEASVEVVPNEDGQGSVAELIIVDDQVTPESIDEQMIEIEVPGQEDVEGGLGGEQLPGQGREGLDMPPEGGQAPEMGRPEGGEPAPREQDEGQFDRFEDLAGLKK